MELATCCWVVLSWPLTQIPDSGAPFVSVTTPEMVARRCSIALTAVAFWPGARVTGVAEPRLVALLYQLVVHAAFGSANST